MILLRNIPEKMSIIIPEVSSHGFIIDPRKMLLMHLIKGKFKRWKTGNNGPYS